MPKLSEKGKKKDLLNRLEDYEENKLSEREEISLFQELINSGIVWNLGSGFGRTANTLIEKGLCTNG